MAKYEEIQKLAKIGLRKPAKQLIADLIKDFNASPSEEFALKICTECEASKIDQEIYRSIAYPYINEKSNSEPLWMVAAINTHNNAAVMRKLDPDCRILPPVDLLKRLNEHPEYRDYAKPKLFAHIFEYLESATHEYPSGILYGNDGANIEQCTEYLSDIEYLKENDPSEIQSEFLHSVEEKISICLKQLIEIQSNNSGE